MLIFKCETYVKKQVFIAGVLNIGHVLAGYCAAWSSPIIPKLQDLSQTPLSHIICISQASWIASSSMVGLIFGPYITGICSNMIGRKLCFIVGGFLYALSSSILASANTFAMIVALRIVNGFSASIIFVNGAVYIGEISSLEIRGIILSSTSLFFCLGALLVNCVGPFASYATVNYIILSMSLLYIICVFTFIPESPVYLMLKGDENRARHVLKHLGRDKKMDTELKAINEIITKKEERKWSELFTLKSNRRSLLITLPLFLFQECSGTVPLMKFTTSIFQLAGSSIKPNMATVIFGLTQLCPALLVPIVIEKFGRKLLLLISTFSVTISMAMIAVYFYLDLIIPDSIASIRWIPLLSMVLSNSFYNFGLGVIPGVLTGELFSANVRSLGACISMSTGWLLGLFVISSFGYVVEALGNHVVFAFFSVSNLVAFMFVIFCITETKGLSLAEIQTALSK